MSEKRQVLARILSGLIDWTIILIVFIIIINAFDIEVLATETNNLLNLLKEGKLTSNDIVNYLSNISTLETLLLTITLTAFYFLYMIIIPIITNGKTITLLFFKLRMVKLNETRMSFGTLFIRQYIARMILPLLTFGLSHLINIILLLVTKGSRNIPDRMSNTLVVADTLSIKRRFI